MLPYGLHTTRGCSGAVEHSCNGRLCIVLTCSWYVANFSFLCVHGEQVVAEMSALPAGMKEVCRTICALERRSCCRSCVSAVASSSLHDCRRIAANCMRLAKGGFALSAGRRKRIVTNPSHRSDQHDQRLCASRLRPSRQEYFATQPDDSRLVGHQRAARQSASQAFW
jgi:hypothetical protein